MSKLTDEQYSEYHRLLTEWIEAEREAKRSPAPGEEALERARRAYGAVQRFRANHELDGHEREPQPAAYGR